MYEIQYYDKTDIDTTTMMLEATVHTDKVTTGQQYNTKVITD